MLLPEPPIPGRVGLVGDPLVWIRIRVRACVLASASVIARGRGRVVQML